MLFRQMPGAMKFRGTKIAGYLMEQIVVQAPRAENLRATILKSGYLAYERIALKPAYSAAIRSASLSS